MSKAAAVKKTETATLTLASAPTERATISRPNIRTVAIAIRGTAPYVQNKFSAKAMAKIHETQSAGSVAKKGAKREPKDFQAAYKGAMHRAVEGWCGIPAPAFRNGMISACKICGFHMTKGKLAVFVEADGIDAEDGTPLVRITKGEPEYHESAVRNESGVVDLRARPMWREWEATVRVKYDADMFSASDIANLMIRVGMQVGVGEGRPDSKSSNGMGWGTFSLTE